MVGFLVTEHGRFRSVDSVLKSGRILAPTFEKISGRAPTRTM